MAEKYADLRIRARDEFSKVLENGRKSLDKFVESASRKDILKASIAQKQAIADQRLAVQKLQEQYAAMARQANAGGYTRQLAVDMVSLRDKIYKARDALNEQSVALQKLRGSASSFSAFSRGVDQMRQGANTAAASVDNLRNRIRALKAAQEDAAAKARTYLSNQAQANAVGGGFGATNAQLGRKFADEAKSLKRDIVGLEASIHRLNGATQGSFGQFDKKARDLEKTGSAARSASSGLGQLSEAEKKLNSALRATETSRERAARMASELRAEESALIAKYGAESAEAKKLSLALAALDAKAQGVRKSQIGMRGAIDGATGSLVRQGRSAKQNWGSQFVGEDQEVMAFGLRPYQLTNLSYQVNDVVSGLAMGQPILQIFAQQVGQLLQIFPSFSRGMMSVFQILERYPARAGAAAAALVLVGSAMRRVTQEAADSREAMAGAENILVAFGDGASYSVNAIAQAAIGMKDVAGSIEEATKLARAFTQVGIRQDRFEELADVAAKFAQVTGDEVPEAGKKLATAFSGGFDSLREFDKEMNIFTASELEAIRAMYAAGDAAGAQELAFDTLQSKLEGAASVARGPWAEAFSSIGDIWGSLVDSLSNSVFIQGTVELINLLGKGVGQLAEEVNHLVESSAFKVLTGDFTPIFGGGAEDVDSLRKRVVELTNAINFIEQGGDTSALSPFWTWLVGTDRMLEEMQAQLVETEGKLADLGESVDPGLTIDRIEALRKEYGDFSAALDETNKKRGDETRAIGLSKRELEIETTKREALSDALERGLTRLPDWAALWAKETAAIEDSVNAKHDAIDAAERLRKAQELVSGAIAGARTEQEKTADEIARLETAINDLAAELGDSNEKVVAGREALAKMREEASKAETALDKLRQKVPALADEMKRLEEQDAIKGLLADAIQFAVQSEGVAAAWERVAAAIANADSAAASGSLLDLVTSLGGASAKILEAISLAGQAQIAQFDQQVSGYTGTDAVELSAQFLRDREDFRSEPYYDVNAFRVGYGSDTITLSDGTIQRVTEGMRVSVEDANRDLYRRIETEFMPAARSAAGAERFDGFTAQQQAALTSIAYNYGSLPERIIDAVRNGTDAEIAQAIRGLGSDNDGVNRDRRNLEASLFSSSVGVDSAEQAAAQTREAQREADEKRIEDQQAFLADQREKLENAEFELSLEGRRIQDAEVAKALREAELAAQKVGLELTSEQRAEIERVTRAKFASAQADEDRNAKLEEAKALEEQVTLLQERRRFLIEQQTQQEGQGDLTAAARTEEELQGVEDQLDSAIEKALQFWEALGGEGSERAILGLQTVRQELQKVESKAIFSGEQINNMIADGLTSAITSFSQAVANGEDAWAAFRDAALKALSDVLIQIGTAIIRAALLNALTGGAGGGAGIGGGLAGLINGFVAHTGGVVGAGIAQRRTVSPDIFLGATRYHTGGVIGLKPNERPIIAEVGEEMLTEDDPRHRNNGGGANGGTTIINTIDPDEVVSRSLSGAPGRRILVNAIRGSKSEIKAVLS